VVLLTTFCTASMPSSNADKSCNNLIIVVFSLLLVDDG